MLRGIFRVSGDDEGQALADYALILSLIAVVAILALIFMGTQIRTILSQIGVQL
jgi:Flp pilus assembly pilin Flp